MQNAVGGSVCSQLAGLKGRLVGTWEYTDCSMIFTHAKLPSPTVIKPHM